MDIKINKKLVEYIENHFNVLNFLSKNDLPKIVNIANLIKRQIKKKNKILVIGNGGSAADSDHFVAELMVKFKKKRKPIPAISLSNNGPLITAHSNDLSYKFFFKRQIEALGKKGDVLIAITTSGRSQNIIEAVRYAKKINLKIVTLTGRNQTYINDASDYCVNVNSSITSIIQEIHILIIHLICELVE